MCIFASDKPPQIGGRIKRNLMNDGINQLNLSDVPQLASEVRYFDGEIGFADDIHLVEKLASVFKVNFVAMVFCISGKLSLKINSNSYDIQANDGILINMQSVVSDISHDSDMSCKVIFMSLDGGIMFLTKTVFETFMNMRAEPVVHFTPHEMELMSKYYELVLFKMEHPTVGAIDKGTMHAIFRAYVLDMIASINSRLNVEEDKMILRQSDKIFHRFIMLLAKSDGTQRSVTDYANELCVSSKYLTSICRKHESKTASELITINAIAQIKQLLLYSSLSIKEIALKMGFDNLSFFGKYVKKHLGSSPNNFRKINGYGK